MSNRAMGRLYGGMANNRGPSWGGGDGPSLLATLFGQADITPPDVKTGPDGSIQLIPAQGSKGIFGARSRYKAAEMNLPLLQQYMLGLQNIQGTKTEGEEQRKIAAAAVINDLAKKHDITPDQVKDIQETLLKNSQMQLANQGQALNPDTNPSIIPATKMGANLAASGVPPQMLGTTTGPGQISTIPSIPGVPQPDLVRGATPETSVVPTKVIPDGKGGTMPIEFTPVTRMSRPGGLEHTPSPDILRNAAQMQGASQMSTGAGLNPLSFLNQQPPASVGGSNPISTPPDDRDSGVQTTPPSGAGLTDKNTLLSTLFEALFGNQQGIPQPQATVPFSGMQNFYP